MFQGKLRGAIVVSRSLIYFLISDHRQLTMQNTYIFAVRSLLRSCSYRGHAMLPERCVTLIYELVMVVNESHATLREHCVTSVRTAAKKTTYSEDIRLLHG